MTAAGRASLGGRAAARHRIAAGFLAALLAICLPLPAIAQVFGPPAPTSTEAATDAATTLDYSAWERMASRVETAIEAQSSANATLEDLRLQLVDWREALLGAQNANVARLATLRAQIAALGAIPTDGSTEPPEIAERRRVLTEQLVRLQAPGIAAEEAYLRADGLIREIDRALRERQADQLLQLWPSPLNPGNWPEAVIALSDTGIRLWDEVTTSWASRFQRQTLQDNLPVVVLLAAISAVLVLRSRRWVAWVWSKVELRLSPRWRPVAAVLISLGEIAFPFLGVVLAASALRVTGLPGPIGTAIVDAFPVAALPAIVANWIAGRVFGAGEGAALRLSEERRAEGRYLSFFIGALMGIAALRFAAMDAQAYSDGATAVLSYPMIALTGLLLWRRKRCPSRHRRSPVSAIIG
jgi:potassium-dependent mechanosensitive channel